MINELWEKASGFVRRRTTISLGLPVLIFLGGVATLVVVHVGWRHIDDAWRQTSATATVVLVAGALIAVLGIAQLIAHHLVPLTRFFEGYWGGLGRPTANWGVRRQRKEWRKATRYSTRFHRFPATDSEVLPTRLGNVLKAAESYISDPRRYGADAVFFWPHLLAVLPESTRADLAEARASVETTLVATSLAILFAPVAVVLGLSLPLPTALWIPVTIGTLVLARICYLASVRAAISWGVLIRAAFDLHHRDLLHALGFRPPCTLEEERALWMAVGKLLYRRDDRADLVVYTEHPPK